ncbi:MAG: FKBP-type peptidyl-prolyl cis-trans isomerase [Pseudomonadota bacterium]
MSHAKPVRRTGSPWLLALVTAACCAVANAQSTAESKDGQQELNTPARGFSYSLGVQTGNNIRKQLPQALADIDLEAMMLGIRDRLEGRENRLDVAEMTFWSGKFLQMLEARRESKKADNLVLGKQFRDDYATRDGVRSTSSGVLYKELAAGSGRQPGIGQSVRLHFKGRLVSGRQFGDSRADSAQPAEISVREMRPGLQEAVTLMQKGGRWEVVIPPELAYGEAGAGDVGPNETLIYEIELIDIF